MDASQPTVPLSRRERRELNRSNHQAQQGSDRFRRRARRLLIWGLGLALLVGFGWLMVKLAGRVPLASDGGTLAVAVSDTDNSSGPNDAPVTLVEYSDFQCPACAAFQPLIKELLADSELAGKVRFVYRHFPLTNIHANAELAARAAQAAAKQGKFWEMHDILFKNQTTWSGMSSARAREEFWKYATSTGINSEWFAGDMDADDVKKKVADDLKGGNASGVSSTPSFYVNGVKMPHPNSYEEFKQAIISHLTPTPSPDATP